MDSRHRWKRDGGMAWRRKSAVSVRSSPGFLSVWRIFLGETLGNEMFGKRYGLFASLSTSGLRIYSYHKQDAMKNLFIEQI